MNVQISGGTMGWASMGLATVVVGSFIISDLFFAGAPGRSELFGSEVRLDRLIVMLVASVPWLLLLGLYRLTHQVRRPPSGPASEELPTEAPAIANMLANGFEPTREAVPATVLDLAARGVVDIEEVGSDRFQVRLRDRAKATPLLPFERRALELLSSRAVKGVVPAEALTTGPEQRSKRWWKDLRREVTDSAKARGLSRDLWQGWVLTAAAVLAIPPLVLAGWAFRDWAPSLWYFFLVATVLGALVEGRRQRETPEGYRRASQILGLRRFLREGAFEHLPPTAVAIWERHLAYAVALGVARRSLRAIPVGADDDHRAWAPLDGEWQLVRVRYPRYWPPGWGRSPSSALALGLLGAGVAALFIYARYRFVPEVLGALELSTATERWVRVGAAVLVVVVAALGLRALLMALVAATDLGARRTRTGTVLRLRTFGRGSDLRHYVAIADGRSDLVRAFRIPPKHRWSPVAESRSAFAVYSPRLGYVRELRPELQDRSENVASGS